MRLSFLLVMNMISAPQLLHLAIVFSFRRLAHTDDQMGHLHDLGDPVHEVLKNADNLAGLVVRKVDGEVCFKSDSHIISS